MTGAKDLIGPNGQHLIKEQKLIVIKSPREVRIYSQVMEFLSKVTGCSVFNIPMDSELIMGDLAVRELASLHQALHAFLTVPDSHFSKDELNILYSALRFLCEKTAPADSAAEVSLLKKVKKLAE